VSYLRVAPLLLLLACERQPTTRAQAPPASTAPSRCGDLRLTSIANVRFGFDEPTVLRELGIAPHQTAPQMHFEPNAAEHTWYSEWRWPAHDLTVTWASVGSAAAPRKVYGITLGPNSDVATSCGVRIGTTRAQVEHAYRDALDEWNTRYAPAAGAGMLSAPSGSGSAPDTPIMLISNDGLLIAWLSFAADRLTEITLTSAALLFVGQW